MEYYSILNFDREPFSNSPDPRFFFHSRQHHECLNKIEISIRLKRGLCVILGEVGTGKSTLCRELIRRLAEDDMISTHLIMDPLYASDSRFLSAVSEAVTGIDAGDADEWTLKERIKHHLFQEGVEKGRTVTLIIDEGQKIRETSLEFLREFLNYETNDHKLVQIVIFAQSEFADMVNKFPNFADRVNLTYRLGPLSLRDTARMIRSRLALSGGQAKSAELFTPLALWAIHRATKGYPRRIIHLCHHCLLTMIIQNKTRVGARIVAFCVRHHREGRLSAPPRRLFAGLAAILLAVAVAIPTYHWVVRGPASNPDTVAALTLPVVEGEPATAGQKNEKLRALETFRPVPAQIEAATDENQVALSHKEESAPDDFLEETPAGEVFAPEDEGGTTQSTAQEPALNPDQGMFQKDGLLGVVTVLPGETISSLMQRIYGAFTLAAMERVLRANPQVGHPDTILRGDRLHFPAIPAPVSQQTGTWHWVQIAETETLQSAVTLLRGYPTGAPPALLVPFSTNREYKFRIVLGQPVRSRDEAVRLQSLVPRDRGYETLVFNQWPQDAVFYADPYR
ncbi:general secretion pathway protein A [Desulfonatronum thiosulfatophilum]|uniref:General secretion pathway protein A n=1 Tax=Desulfonatronum thiosulfatophilum TaxID=617002 RepID=A0A1G6CNL1_9BACT|nr:AAA family ATPase [Desulfonatronum thiosulfatophilum]SDB34315.1 general secretion pathway protein A [Desulfonatronum thiosulfatophilum]